VRTGNAEAIQPTRQAGREIGEVLATLVNTLNPSIIVIGGSIAGSGEQLLAEIREVIYHRSTPLATQNLSIVQSQAGGRRGVGSRDHGDRMRPVRRRNRRPLHGRVAEFIFPRRDRSRSPPD
jgi:predicted NBD/HSP70 family sugar kinase